MPSPMPPWSFFEDAVCPAPQPPPPLHDYRDLPSAGFLALPRELRDMIYDYFLEINHAAPPSPPFAGKRKYRRARSDSDQRMRDIEYAKSLPRDPSRHLLHTCHTTRTELLDLLTKRNKSGCAVRGEIDIMAKGYIFLPTWTTLPTLPSRTTPWDLTVDLRVFSPEAFQSNDGWPRNPGFAFRDLLLLLNQFRTCGPSFTMSQAEHMPGEPPIRLRSLVIRLSNLDIYTPRMFPSAVYETVRMCKALALRGDARDVVEHIKIVVEDQDLRVPGLQGRTWEFDVLDVHDEAQISAWEEAGFHLQPQVADFSTVTVT